MSTWTEIPEYCIQHLVESVPQKIVYLRRSAQDKTHIVSCVTMNVTKLIYETETEQASLKDYHFLSQYGLVTFAPVQQDPASYLQIERGDCDIMASLPQQILIMWYHHKAIMCQMTIHLQHLSALLRRTDNREKIRIIKMMTPPFVRGVCVTFTFLAIHLFWEWGGSGVWCLKSLPSCKNWCILLSQHFKEGSVVLTVWMPPWCSLSSLQILKFIEIMPVVKKYEVLKMSQIESC